MLAIAIASTAAVTGQVSGNKLERLAVVRARDATYDNPLVRCSEAERFSVSCLCGVASDETVLAALLRLCMIIPYPR